MTSAYKWFLLAVSIALVTSGCGRSGYYYDRNDEYQQAEMSEPLRLPETRELIRYQDAMPVPQASNDFMADEDFEAPRPQPLTNGAQGERPFVELREAGNERWLLVDSAPASVWPRLQAFVQQQGLDVRGLDANSGRIETRQGEITVRQGLRTNTSEVRCQSTGGQCLTALSRYLEASGEQQQSVSLAAQNLSRDDRVRLENNQGEWQLLLAIGFDRAWSELHYQLENSFDRQGRKLVDRNRSAGEFLVDYTPQGSDDGGFFGLFSDEAEARRYRLDVDGVTQDTTRVRVATTDDAPLTAGEARELLDTLAATLR